MSVSIDIIRYCILPIRTYIIEYEYRIKIINILDKKYEIYQKNIQEIIKYKDKKLKYIYNIESSNRCLFFTNKYDNLYNLYFTVNGLLENQEKIIQKHRAKQFKNYELFIRLHFKNGELNKYIDILDDIKIKNKKIHRANDDLFYVLIN